MSKFFRAFRNLFLAALALVLVNCALHFPYAVDVPLSDQELEAARKYYTEAYQKSAETAPTNTEYESEYIRVAEAMAEARRIRERVAAFVEQYQLRDRPVLEIGSGRGNLQDVAGNYTGLDISPSVARFYHKKFVVGSATAMPFADDSFDGIWSIWVLEHIPAPEQALLEARRVIRDQGVIFLLPEWNCAPWLADGYEVRSYSDFGIIGKLIKASIPTRTSTLFNFVTYLPIRAARGVAANLGPTRLRYRRLQPNYDKYWMPDSDAVSAIDSHEALVWFLSRGDECLNCDRPSLHFPFSATPLVIRVHKRGR